jgi:hypothetical protein
VSELELPVVQIFSVKVNVMGVPHSQVRPDNVREFVEAVLLDT